MSSTTAPSVATSFTQRLIRSRPEDVLPLDIEHQRVYILPTKRGLAYLFTLLIMLIASINYALSLGYALCFLLTGLFGASLLHTYRNVAGITCEKISSEHVFVGQKTQFAVDIKNKTKLGRVGVTIKCADAFDAIDIKPGDVSTAMLIKPATTRGIVKLGRITVTSSYPLGLWRTWCYVHSDEQSLIYPRPESNPPPLPSSNTDSSGEIAQKSIQGDVSGLRNYNPGDAIAAIAWKAAARGQGLFVKTFDDENVGGQTQLNLAITDLHDTEQQLCRLCAWVLAAEQAQTDYSFDVENTQLAAGHGAAHKRTALMALASYGTSSSGTSSSSTPDYGTTPSGNSSNETSP